MNFPINPDVWEAAWHAWCEARQSALDSEAPREESGDEFRNWHTVSTGSEQMAAHILKKLKSSTAPTLAQEILSRDDGASENELTISAAPADAPWRKGAGKKEEGAARLGTGAILHLHPELGVERAIPVHAAVIAHRAEDSRVLLAPFSPLSVPSCEGELLTGIEDASLGVICLWNARWVGEGNARRSWLADWLDPTLLADALRLRDSLRRGEGVPADLRERVAPPVVHPEDPRRKYLDEMEDLLGEFGIPDGPEV